MPDDDLTQVVMLNGIPLYINPREFHEYSDYIQSALRHFKDYQEEKKVTINKVSEV